MLSSRISNPKPDPGFGSSDKQNIHFAYNLSPASFNTIVRHTNSFANLFLRAIGPPTNQLAIDFSIDRPAPRFYLFSDLRKIQHH